MDKTASLSAKPGRIGRRVRGPATDDELWSEQHQTTQPGGPGQQRAPDGKGFWQRPEVPVMTKQTETLWKHPLK